MGHVGRLVAIVAVGLSSSSLAAQEVCRSTFQDYGDPLAEVTCLCEAGRLPGTVYGDLTYTGDSDLCAAATHAGALMESGSVTLRGTAGCQTYTGAVRNGIESLSWGAWDSAFFFPAVSDGACASGAAAASAPAVAGDAMDVLLGLLTASLPPGGLTVGSATKLGPNAFELKDVLLRPDANGPPIEIAKLSVQDVDLPGLVQGGFPSVLNLTATGLSVPTTGLDPQAVALFGDRVAMDVVVDYTLDPVTQDLAIRDVQIDLPNLAKIALKADFQKFSLEQLLAGMLAPTPSGAGGETAIRSLVLTLDDRGFLGRAIQSEIDPAVPGAAEAYVAAELQALADSAATAGVLKDTPAWSLMEALGGMLANHAAPQGPLVVTIQPAQPLRLADVMAAGSLGESSKVLGMKVAYAAPAVLPEPQAALPNAGAGPSVSTLDYAQSYAAGEAVEIAFLGLPGSPQDRVAVVPLGSPDDFLGDKWMETGGQTEGVYRVEGLADGTYEARLYLAGSSEVASRFVFSIGGTP